MVKIGQGEVADQARIDLHLPIDGVPDQVNSKNISFVYSINNRYETHGFSNTVTTSGDVTVFTVPAGRKFVLTSINLAYTKDATSDNVLVTGVVYVDNDSKSFTLCNLPCQTTTAVSNATDHWFGKLILNEGDKVKVSGSFTAGTMSKRCSITGFYI